jgi:hypothetical protein
VLGLSRKLCGKTRHPEHARRWALGLGAAAVLALLMFWLRSRGAEAPVRHHVSGAQHPAPGPSETLHNRAVLPPARESPPRATSAPVIDEIVVEKPELCAGEETLVSVRAHTPDASDAELHYLIGTGTGQSVPLRAWLDEQGQPPPFQVTVFGKGNVATSVPVPALRVRPCRVGTFVVLTHRSLPNRWGGFELHAQLREPPGGPASAPASPRRYDWSFGDGTRDETSSSAVTHSYEDRPQQALYSQFLVRVDVTTRDGRTLVARDALQLPNPAYEAWTRKGIVSLLVALDPPFPVLSASGRVEQGVRLRHYRPDAVEIESVKAVRYYADGAGESPPQTVDVRALLGTSHIPPGNGVALQVVLDARAEPDVLSVSYYLKGTSAEGRPVVGSFSVMRPPPKPTAGNSTPVSDPRLLARIQRARERLGKDVVSSEDLARLQRQGELEDW